MSDQARRNTEVQTERHYPPGYGVVEPVANYRPWDVDEEFRSVYEDVREHTMVDIYRLWTLWYIARQFGLAGQPESGSEQLSGDVLEVGSWRGGSGAVIARGVASGRGRADAGPAVFLADTFAGVVKAGERDTYYKGGEHANTSVDAVRQLLVRAGVAQVQLLVGVFPEESGAEIVDRRFALCHIDVDVYQSARDAFEWVWPRLVPGGVVVFDDFGFYGCEGVTSYVNELAVSTELTVVPSLSGQAIITRAVY